MKEKYLIMCLILLTFCSGSAGTGILQPHFTLSQTYVELGMDDVFDPYAYVLKNGRALEEEDKDYLYIEGSYPKAVPGDYEITYNQYMKLRIRIKDTEAPLIEVPSFTWGQGIPFIWNEETKKRIRVSDNYTAAEKLRETISCGEFDTAYLGERKTTCSVSDEAGNTTEVAFTVSIIKSTHAAIPEEYAYLQVLPYDEMQLSEIVQVLTYVNQMRASAGLEPVELGNADLMKVTYERAKEVQQLYSHDRPNGKLCFTILDDYDYKYKAAGENVAKGQQSAWEVIQDWMASDTHQSIIQTPEFTELGISVIGEGENKVWTLIFVH